MKLFLGIFILVFFSVASASKYYYIFILIYKYYVYIVFHMHFLLCRLTRYIKVKPWFLEQKLNTEVMSVCLFVK